jgi:hypothetical protein
VGGKLPDREIGEFQENPKNTEPDRVQETCEVEMSFTLVRISYKCCGLIMKFNGLTILTWIAQCVFRIQQRPKLQVNQRRVWSGEECKLPLIWKTNGKERMLT